MTQTKKKKEKCSNKSKSYGIFTSQEKHAWVCFQKPFCLCLFLSKTQTVECSSFLPLSPLSLPYDFYLFRYSAPSLLLPTPLFPGFSVLCCSLFMSLPLKPVEKRTSLVHPVCLDPVRQSSQCWPLREVPVKPMNLCMVQSAMSAKVASGAKFCSEYSLSSSSFQVIIDSFPKQQYPLCRDWEQRERVVGFTLDRRMIRM